MIAISGYEADFKSFYEQACKEWFTDNLKAKIEGQHFSIKEALVRDELFNRRIGWHSDPKTVFNRPAIFKFFHLNDDGTENIIYVGTTIHLRLRMKQVLFQEKPHFLKTEKRLFFKYSYNVVDYHDRYLKRNMIWTTKKIHETIYKK